MSKNLAIVVPSAASGKLAPAKPVDIPTPGHGELLIRVEACAQNPVDPVQAATGYAVASFPIILGCDAAGVVLESTGQDVGSFKAGDHVATLTPLGRESKYGTYQRYCVTKAASSIKIPESMPFDQAATLPLGFYTAAIGVHTMLGVPIPLEKGKVSRDVGIGEWMLVWGASSSVGAAAVQLAKAAGFHVVATASKHNFEYVKSLGTDVVLDYHDRNVIEKIHAAASLSLAFNAISTLQTTEACMAALTDGGKVANVLPFDGVKPDGVEVLVVQSTVLNQPEHLEELKAFTALWQALVDAGKLKPSPVQLMPDGLNSIDHGFELQHDHKISGHKLVYLPQETPEA
ncbi:GroES-like protein [Dacryopinax primogenitus]|uniref:GroES-like protein n=1 Tax=Dacryopinax primogenitus (strain DJM 731) TaxID=1858805 RepID=M5FTL7_DACPD|nr:GroES-like protein [Dacryopinax primogenitus]EJT98744.1 GroES-like protein [Dacryopinax primogenitus]